MKDKLILETVRRKKRHFFFIVSNTCCASLGFLLISSYLIFEQAMWIFVILKYLHLLKGFVACYFFSLDEARCGITSTYMYVRTKLQKR
jgi:hypothetical protein